MVAEPGPDVRIWLLTCSLLSSYGFPATTPGADSSGWHRPGRLLAAICAQYVPKF